METGCLGSVTHPTAEELAAMQKSHYILHACGGELTKVAVEKSQLPHDPYGHTQIEETAVGPDGAVYVNQSTIMCKSTDGGRTWTSYERDWPGAGHIRDWPAGEIVGLLEILSDGTFITVTGSGTSSAPMEVWASSDEGRTWRRISHTELELPAEYTDLRRMDNRGLFRLRDDTLLIWVGARGYDEDGTSVSLLLSYRSTDQGNSWQGPSKICNWGSEGGIAQMASGKLLATIRYQGNPEPGVQGKITCLVDSDDEGRSWQNFRQLTTVHGQCHGEPAALSDGTVVVVHDSRYGPGPPGGRAIVSYDEGQAWEDEVYYMYCGTAQSGYSQNVVLEDDLILTICGTSDYEGGNPGAWDNWIGNSDLTAIRWKPESRG